MFENFDTISSKTSNNQEIIDRMPYWKFVNLTKIRAKIIERENNQTNGENAEEKTKELMDNAKKGLPNMKIPKAKMPKYK